MQFYQQSYSTISLCSFRTKKLFITFKRSAFVKHVLGIGRVEVMPYTIQPKARPFSESKGSRSQSLHTTNTLIALPLFGSPTYFRPRHSPYVYY